MKAKVLVLTLGIILLFTVGSGCLGEHKTCPKCEGTGRNIWTLFFTECGTCGGDGEVGLFMDDEDTEDSLSFLLIGILIIGVVAAVIMEASKKTPPSQQPIIIQQPQQPQQPLQPYYQDQPPPQKER